MRPGGGLVALLKGAGPRWLGPQRWYAVRKTARHLIEARTAFANWPSAMWQIAGGSLQPAFVVTLRDGSRLSCPNLPAARAPLYNIFAEHWYPLDEFGAGIPPQSVVFDLGAHIGAFTVTMARRRPDVQVIAMEAAASSHTWLVDNVASNQLSGRVCPVLAAAWGETGTVHFQDNGGASCINSVVDTYASEYLTGVASEAVPTLCAADVFALAAGRPIGLVKMDCEGAEFDFVLRSQPADWRAVHQVYLEYHPSSEYQVDDLVSWFRSAGLHVRRLLPTRFGMGDMWLRRDG